MKVMLLSLVFIVTIFQQCQSKIVILNKSPIISDTQPTFLHCMDVKKGTQEGLLTIIRQFQWGRTIATGSTSSDESTIGARAVWSGSDTIKAVGGFGCGRGPDAVSAVKMLSEGSIIPRVFSAMTYVGGKAVIEMKNRKESSVDYRTVTWYKNGHIIVPETGVESRIWKADGGLSLVINSVEKQDAGIYMAYRDGEKQIYAAGTELIVRNCPLDRWSEDCNRHCPVCQNGGVCNDLTGRCDCLPGFNGTVCQHTCEPSYFGAKCEDSCQHISEGASSCRGFQHCTTEGCFCVNGWTGLDCQQACPTGYYGAGCKNKCNCPDEGTCDQYRGCVCGHDRTPCQIPEDEVMSTTRSTAEMEAPQESVKPVLNVTKIEADPSFTVNVKERVTIGCTVTGDPAPQHGEVKLLGEYGVSIPPTESITSEYVTKSRFLYTMTSYAGPFLCVAKTRMGQTRREFYFKIPGLPTPIKPPELIEAKPNYLKVKLNSFPFHGDGPIINTRLLKKRTEGSSSFATYRGSIVNDTAVLTDLQPFSNYTFRVLLRREGKYGMGHPGPSSIIRTFCDHPKAAPTIRSIYAKNDTNLFLSWSLPSMSEIRGEVIGYRIYYKVLGDDSPRTKITFTYRSKRSTTLADMTPLAVYSVWIQLENCAGYSPLSDEVRVTMGKLETPAGPEIISMNKTSRSAEFVWLPPSNAKPYTISGYETFIQKSDSNGAPKRLNVSDRNFSTYNLMPFTEYIFKVRAYNHEGPGNYSEPKAFTTKEEAPGMPSNFRVTDMTVTSIEVAWDPPSNPNGLIREYLLNYSSVDGKWIQANIKNKLKATIENLKEFSEYWIRIQAVTVEPGNWSETLLQKTMTSKPLDTPKNIELINQSPESVLIRWKPPLKSKYEYNVTNYKIIHTDDLRQNIEHWKSQMVSGKERSIEIDRLRPDTVYLFKIAAKTLKFGAFTEYKSIRTKDLTRPPRPHDVSITNVTTDSAVVNWKITNGYSVSGVKIRWKGQGTSQWNEISKNQESTWYRIDLLNPGTYYSLQLIAYNKEGDSSPYQESFKTALIKQNPANKKWYLIAGGAGGGVAFIAIVAYLRCRCRRKSELEKTPGLELEKLSQRQKIHRQSTIRSSFNADCIKSRSGTLISSNSVHSCSSKGGPYNEGQLVVPEHLILSWENIFFEDITLGEGNFGQVVKAIIQIDEKCIEAAVKTLKDGCSIDDRKDFLAEVDMMVRLGKHPNIISVIGACEHNSSLYLCTEFAPNGNLLQFLRKSRKAGNEATYTYLTQGQLLQFALDVCQGMAYLSERELIHRDLAARNVLLSANLTCKISDFGLSRGEGVYVKRTVARLPIRWMAIESLNYNVYTTQSDVWSFGVLLWEIVSLGGTPYYGMSCAELYEKLPRGYRMEQPLNCDGEIYKLMCQCWKDRPHERPSFSQLSVALRRMIEARTNINYVNTAIFENFSFFKIDANEEEED